jgi:sRNA-binding carbon storage regulator CsrA
MLLLTVGENDGVTINHQYTLIVKEVRSTHIVFTFLGQILTQNLGQELNLLPQVYIKYLKLKKLGASLGFTAPRAIAINRVKVEGAIMEGTPRRRNNSKPA